MVDIPRYVRSTATRLALLAVLGGAALVVISLLAADDASAAVREPAGPVASPVGSTVDRALEAVAEAVEPATAPVTGRLPDDPLPLPPPLPDVRSIAPAPAPTLPILTPGSPEPAPLPESALAPPTSTESGLARPSPWMSQPTAPSADISSDRTELREIDRARDAGTSGSATALSPSIPEPNDRFPHQAAVLVQSILLGGAGLRRRIRLGEGPPTFWWPALDTRPG